MKARDYQQRGIDAVLSEFSDGNDTLLVQPTGCGKTITFAKVIESRPGRVLVLAHREELIFQAADKIQTVTGEVPDIEMGDYRANETIFGGPRIIVSTVQTQVAGRREPRMQRFTPRQFSTVIVDEAHHAASASYRRVISHYQQNPDCRVLGVSATPDRADGLALGSVFDTVADSFELDEAIEAGWLVDLKMTSVVVDGLDYSQVRRRGGDLSAADITAVMQYEEVLHRMVVPMIELSAGRRLVGFCASVAHAQRTAEIANRYEPGIADYIFAGTPKDERAAKLAAFRAGHFRMLFNVGVLTEGYDDAGVEVIALCRPTLSRNLYAQCIGRGTRPLPGVVDRFPDNPARRREAIAESEKPFAEVIDFVGNCGRHRLVGLTDILGGREPEPIRDRAFEILNRGGEQMQWQDVIEQAEAEIEAERQEQRRRDEDEEERQRQELTARVNYSTQAFDPFRGSPTAERVTQWDTSKRPSARMVNMLRRAGIPNPEAMSHGEARAMLNEVMSRFKKGQATFGQAKVLSRHRLPTDVSKEKASEWIDAIAKNDWKIPEQLKSEQRKIERF